MTLDRSGAHLSPSAHSALKISHSKSNPSPAVPRGGTWDCRDERGLCDPVGQTGAFNRLMRLLAAAVVLIFPLVAVGATSASTRTQRITKLKRTKPDRSRAVACEGVEGSNSAFVCVCETDEKMNCDTFVTSCKEDDACTVVATCGSAACSCT